MVTDCGGDLTGLRSVRLGEQCEAIVRFPRLFEKYPFPILINSAFLKLAEVFRTGSVLVLERPQSVPGPNKKPLRVLTQSLQMREKDNHF